MNPGFPRAAPTPKGGVTNQLLPPATKLREGNVFTPVCDSVHGRERSVQGGLYQGDPLPYGNVQALRILLECILVLSICFLRKLHEIETNWTQRGRFPSAP